MKTVHRCPRWPQETSTITNHPGLETGKLECDMSSSTFVLFPGMENGIITLEKGLAISSAHYTHLFCDMGIYLSRRMGMTSLGICVQTHKWSQQYFSQEPTTTKYNPCTQEQRDRQRNSGIHTSHEHNSYITNLTKQNYWTYTEPQKSMYMLFK